MDSSAAFRWAAATKADVKIYEAASERANHLYHRGESDPMTAEYKLADMERTHAASNIHRHFNHDELLGLCEWIMGNAAAIEAAHQQLNPVGKGMER